MTALKAEVQVAGSSIIFPLDENLIPKATSILIAKNISIYGISNIKKSLEEVFLEILNKNKNSSASVAIL